MAHGRNSARRLNNATKKINRAVKAEKKTIPKRRMTTSSQANNLTGPDGASVRGTMRQLLRGTNPRIQGMRPKRSIRESDAYNAIVNEYRHSTNLSPEQAWEKHSVATQLVQAYDATTENANTLYQSGWAPVRSQQRAVNNVAKQVGMDLTTNISQNEIGDMLLFSNQHAANNAASQIFGNDGEFADIFGGGGGDAQPKQQQKKQHMRKTGIFNDPTIDTALQIALNDSLNFANPLDVKKKQQQQNAQRNHISIDEDGEVEIEYFDAKIGQRVKVKRRKRFSGQSGWESVADLEDAYENRGKRLFGDVSSSAGQNEDFGSSSNGSSTGSHAHNRRKTQHGGPDGSAEDGVGVDHAGTGGNNGNNGDGNNFDSNNNNAYSKKNNKRRKNAGGGDDGNDNDEWDSAEAYESGDGSYARTKARGVAEAVKKGKKVRNKKGKKIRINWGDGTTSAEGMDMAALLGPLGMLVAGAEVISAASMFTFLWEHGEDQSGLGNTDNEPIMPADGSEMEGDGEEEEDRRPSGRK